MKDIKRSSYISAYPLRVMEEAQAAANEPVERSENSHYLNELLASRAKSISRIRISPMSDPYKAPVNDPFSRTGIPS